MERRLLKCIMNPAMIVTWVLGLGWSASGSCLGASWFHTKFVLVLA